MNRALSQEVLRHYPDWEAYPVKSAFISRSNNELLEVSRSHSRHGFELLRVFFYQKVVKKVYLFHHFFLKN